ncbi:MAG: NADH-quinone oxidoreductase subunit NuoE [Anaerolineae bacterium]|nr:MAG: NADH-quinone oxidoreductase subunit NuoE [Anaerolineae bacterium]
MLSEELKTRITQLKERYPQSKSALLPALHLAQREHDGWLSEEVMAEVAEVMGLPSAEVRSVVSFYTLFNRQPVGRYLVQVCTNISCSLLGAEHIVNHLERKLGIGVGETTPDGLFTLLKVECLGSCGTAPMMQVNDTYYENLTVERVDQILSELAKS